MKRRFTLVFLFLAACAVTSCASRHVEDRTKPTVLSVSPANNATSVAVNTAVTITFSEGMNASTINDASFLLFSASSVTVAGGVTYDPASNVASFTPLAELEHGTKYTATITTAAKDAAGNALGSSFSWSFTTIPAPGALDASFGSGGKVRAALGFSDDVAFAGAIQQDGKIVTAGYSSVASGPTKTNFFTVARFQTNGALDTTFGLQQNGRADYFTGTARSVAVQPDGKIVAGGANDADAQAASDFLVARYNADGTLDGSFASSGTALVDMGFFRDVIKSLAIQSDGKIVVAGDGNNGGATFVSLLARFNTDGTLDASFAASGKRTDTVGTTSRAAVVKIQPDGKIVVGGLSGNAGGPQSIYLARYDSSGALDPSFGSGIVTASTGTDSSISDIVILPDGKILAAGTTNIGADDILLMRFNADGTQDTSFGSNGVVITDDANHGVETAAGLALQTDGKIAVAATFRPLSGVILTSDFALFRFNPDGTVDTGFGNGHGLATADISGGLNDTADAVLIQQDGKIIVAGSAANSSNLDIGLARFWP